MEAWEELFKSRYTEADPDYVAACVPEPSPVVHPWSGDPKRCYDFVARAEQEKRKKRSLSHDRDDGGRSRPPAKRAALETGRDGSQQQGKADFVFVPQANEVGDDGEST